MREDSSTPGFRDSLPDEEWRAVPGLERYAVSSRGRVCGLYGRLLSPWKAGSARQYLYVDLGTRRRATVHALVCEAFHGPKPSPDHEVAHTNGDSMDNSAGNLRWATRLENVADQIRHGTLHAPIYHRDQHPRAKLSSAIVAGLRGRRFAYGEVVALADRYGVSGSTIHRAARGETWR